MQSLLNSSGVEIRTLIYQTIYFFAVHVRATLELISNSLIEEINAEIIPRDKKDRHRSCWLANRVTSRRFSLARNASLFQPRIKHAQTRYPLQRGSVNKLPRTIPVPRYPSSPWYAVSPQILGQRQDWEHVKSAGYIKSAESFRIRLNVCTMSGTRKKSVDCEWQPNSRLG